MTTTSLFATKIYSGHLSAATTRSLNTDLAATAHMLAAEDMAGRRWCKDNAYPGYTSYGSLNDLPWRASVFADLQKQLDGHVRRFARQLAFDLSAGALVCDSLWVNILYPGGHHSGHIHPHSVISGTYYVAVPKAAAAIRFEDPRLAMMMAAPVRKLNAPQDQQRFVSVQPKAGQLLLWESWLRHEVPATLVKTNLVKANLARQDRLSVSFNYRQDVA
jgi:uncharacterized protein (TIGR02466 family)